MTKLLVSIFNHTCDAEHGNIERGPLSSDFVYLHLGLIDQRLRDVDWFVKFYRVGDEHKFTLEMAAAIPLVANNPQRWHVAPEVSGLGEAIPDLPGADGLSRTVYNTLPIQDTPPLGGQQ